ncbi:MAG: cation:proton antiporter [Candidatus Delongbacteria bacterium]|jgi:fructose-specific phosphotransferase system IIA component|nr:cation:proton antiporter [Candidatus Delongbacteria bacterium]
MKFKNIILYILVFCTLIFASDHVPQEDNIIHLMTSFVFHLGLIIFAARFFGLLFEKMNLPTTLGELTAGIVIGPYLLGKVPLPFLGFPHGFFPLNEGIIPISTEIYGVSVIASIMLLFIAGLETDINLLKKYSVTGSIVGLGGLVGTFFPGVIAGMYLFDLPFMDPKCLFLGVMSTATSVGVTARILSKKKYMESPEGVTILTAAIIDDVLGIILLAIILGVSAVLTVGGEIDWVEIGVISTKAISVWIGFTVVGLLLANKISKFLKIFKDKYTFTVLSFGLALFLAGIFESAGLAMIIGAYVMGLTLSKTDLNYVIQDTIHPLKVFFVPIFFTVMGMMVDLNAINGKILLIGFVYGTVAILGKVFGCGIPALFTGFNKIGSLRIGLGMVPRGEVVLIIAGIGLSSNFIDSEIYGIAIMMILMSILLSPPLLNLTLKNKKRGTRKEVKGLDSETYELNLGSEERTEFFESYIIKYFDNEGFFINKITLDHEIYHIRKDDIFVKLDKHSCKILFSTSAEDMSFVRTMIYESFMKLKYNLDKLKDMTNPDELRKVVMPDMKSRVNIDISQILDPNCIELELKGSTKEEVIKELVDLLEKNDKITNKEDIFKEVMTREGVISTGMQNGLAIPHARTEGVEQVQIAIGFKKDGLEFDSIDGLPTKIIILLVSSTKKNDPHIRVLAGISTYLHKKEFVEILLNKTSQGQVWEFFKL